MVPLSLPPETFSDCPDTHSQIQLPVATDLGVLRQPHCCFCEEKLFADKLRPNFVSSLVQESGVSLCFCLQGDWATDPDGPGSDRDTVTGPHDKVENTLSRDKEGTPLNGP